MSIRGENVFKLHRSGLAFLPSGCDSNWRSVVARVSKPAASPTSKSAEPTHYEAAAGLETRDTAGLETCATVAGRFKSHPAEGSGTFWSRVWQQDAARTGTLEACATVVAQASLPAGSRGFPASCSKNAFKLYHYPEAGGLTIKPASPSLFGIRSDYD